MGCRPSLAFLPALALLAVGTAQASDHAGPAAVAVAQARAAYRAGDQLGAPARSRVILGQFPRDAGALLFSAQLARDVQGPVAALPLLERALEIRPKDPSVLGEYAATLGEAGRNRDMLAAVRQLAAVSHPNPRAFFLQAVLAARAGQDELARRLLFLASDGVEPTPAMQWLDGVLALRSSNPAQAVEALDALVRRQPDNLAARVLLGRALLANGEASEVVARFAPDADRGDASPYLLTLVGRAYEQLGRRDEAARYLDRANLPPQTGAWGVTPSGDSATGGAGRYGPAVAVMELRSLIAGNRIAEAEAAAVRLEQRYPGSSDVARAVGDVHLLGGHLGAALACYRRAAMVRSDGALVQRIAVIERVLAGDGAARAMLARRLAANPRERSTAVLLARLAAERGDPQSAATILEYAATIGGPDPRLLAQLADARVSLGQTPAALDAARQAHQIQRGNAVVSRSLALALAAEHRGVLVRR